MEQNTGLLKTYSDVQMSTVSWIWYPYIAVGKITLLEGDPGDGKSTMMLHLIAELSIGGKTPDGRNINNPERVIYQCSEDGAADTIRPRLEAFGANCRNVAFIDEEVHSGLTLDDERIRIAIKDFHPKLVVVDPIQAYIGNEADLHTATRSRKLLRRLNMWAATYDCAIVLIGHLNKKENGKDLYRGLGSIDVIAAARSVLYVERDKLDTEIRIVHQIKNSLVQRGADVKFAIRKNTGFHWISGLMKETKTVPIIKDMVLPNNKHELAAFLIRRNLSEGDVESTEMLKRLAEYNIGRRTIQETKTELGIQSYRKMRKWYWHLDSGKEHGKEESEYAG